MITSTRRDFLALGLGAIGAASRLDSAAAVETGRIECLDYGRSFICNKAAFNRVRFWVESRTILHDDRAGTRLVIYQCGSCKSEDTFAKKNLLKEDNYDFLPIFGDGQILIFRRHSFVGQRYRTITSSEKSFGDLRGWCSSRLIG